MAAFRDSTVAQRELHAATVPTLAAFEANLALLERVRSRFDYDSPPPYTSSTEDEGEPDSDFVDGVGQRAIPHYEAGLQLFGEYMAEYDHLQWFSKVYLVNPELTRLLKYRVTKNRLHILARASVRKRWQTLGVWNDQWGSISSREKTMDPKRNVIRDEKGKIWTWEWQPEDAPHDKTHPAWRAALLRAGLRRGECPMPPPRQNLTSASSDGERESFITSRPRFQFTLSLLEESTRWSRLSMAQIRRANLGSNLDVVKKRWQNKGIWKSEWDKHRPNGEVGWKWRHESRSPEPERYLDFKSNMEQELSPSELEEYERIVPSTPSTPASELWPDWKPEKESAKWKRDKKLAEAPPQYRKTAAKPKRTKSSAAPPRKQSTTKTREAIQSAEVTRPPRRSARIAASEAKKQKLLEEQAKRARREQKKVEPTARGRGAASAVQKVASKSPKHLQGAQSEKEHDFGIILSPKL
ncbi:hypothetical protein NLG97_g5296 [Lecanicillium saksenae]|uniref:Uncharacterized protein n=1 Tax=Lecanicillium saksenae TaxID=468837 RepID=A0ACC1QVE9_9HYPO|nr:hypothetical protein NLG97_g5296 [Lecanicillium saksenae]